MRLEAKRKEREDLHAISKESVKHWENTIEVRFLILCHNFHFLKKSFIQGK